MLSVLKLGCLYTHAHEHTHAAGCERTHKSYVAINDRGSVLNNKNTGEVREKERETHTDTGPASEQCVCVCV